VDIAPANVVLSALMRARDRQGIIVRVYGYGAADLRRNDSVQAGSAGRHKR